MAEKQNADKGMVGPTRDMSRRDFLRLALIGAGAGVLAACAQSPPTAAPAQVATSVPQPKVALPTTAPPTAEPEKDAGYMRPPGNPKRGGTLRTAWGATTRGYDIYSGGNTAALQNMYNNLIRYNIMDGLRTIIPDLATSWDMSADGKTYTFKLRERVKFHDGTGFSSADVVATFSRMLNPPEGMPIPTRGNFDFLDSVEAVDDHTVRFNLSAPRLYFLDLLCGTNMIIYSKKSLEENNYDLREVITPGTGAFKFVEHLAGELWVFERNPDYWDPELPYIDRIEMLHVPNNADRGSAVLTGQANLSWNVAYNTLLEGEKRDDIDTNLLENPGAIYVHFNCTKEPLDDPRVRRAIHLGVTKQNLKKVYASNVVLDPCRWVPHGDVYATPPEVIATLPGYREDKTEDIAEGKRLLAEAGFPDGIKGLEILAAAGPWAELLAPAFQDMLGRDLNIETEIRIQERSVLGEERQKGTFEIMITTRDQLIVDIAPSAQLWWRTGGSQNYGGYSNTELDVVIDQLLAELDVAKRQELINQMMDILDQDPPYYDMGHTYHCVMWDKKLKGLELDNRTRREWGRFETAWFDE